MATVYSAEQSHTKEKQQQDLEATVKEVGREVYRVSSVFPFDLFPDTVIVQTDKVTLVINHFFATKNESPMLYEDLQTVALSTNPFFCIVPI